MRRAVLDTNVIVSGVISDRGIPSQLLSAWRAREWDLVISPSILHEVQRVLSVPKITRTYGLTRQDIVALVQLFSHRALLMTGTLTISPYGPTKLVRVIKSLTAREIFRRVPTVKQHLWDGEIWSDGFYVSTVGRQGSAGGIQHYFFQQGRQEKYSKPHTQQLRLF